MLLDGLLSPLPCDDLQPLATFRNEVVLCLDQDLLEEHHEQWIGCQTRKMLVPRLGSEKCGLLCIEAY